MRKIIWEFAANIARCMSKKPHKTGKFCSAMCYEEVSRWSNPPVAVEVTGLVVIGIGGGHIKGINQASGLLFPTKTIVR